MPYLLTNPTFSDRVPSVNLCSSAKDASLTAPVARVRAQKRKRFQPVEQLLSRCDELTSMLAAA